MSNAPSELGRALIEARREARLTHLDLALAPADIAAAMRVQREVLEAVGASVAGWKVGYTPEGSPVAAPIYAGVTHKSGATLRHGPSRKSGIEVEIALLLGRDLPPRPGRPYDRAEILDAGRAVLAGVEIVASRFPDSPKPPFLIAVADNMGNGGYVPGKAVDGFRSLDLSKLRARLTIDGRKMHDAIGGHAKGDPLSPIIDYVNRPCDILGGLRAGQIVTTGSLSGCPYVEGAVHIVAEVEGLGEIELRFKP